MIRLVHLSKTYGNTFAVCDVNLQVQPGEVFGFIGPNGAGKTTTIKMMAGLLSPTHGSVFIGGVVLQEAGPVYRLFMAGIKCRQVSLWLWNWSVAAFSGALILCLTAVIVSMRFGENRLKQENSHVPCI